MDTNGASDTLEIATVHPNGRGFRKLTHHPSPGYSPRWTSDGRRIVFLSDDAFTLKQENWRILPDGRRRERLPGVVDDPPDPSGRFVALLGTRIRIVTAKGGLVRTLPWRLRRADGYSDEPAAAWSPDGRYLAVNIDSETADSEWVFVIATDGRSSPRVLIPKKRDRLAHAVGWSPDSRRLLISAYSGKKDVWYTVAADGSQRRRLPSVARSASRITWSPDSKQIAYVGKSGGIFEASAAGGRARRVVQTQNRKPSGSGMSVAWSSRGELAFSDTGGLYVVRSNGQGLRRLTRKGVAPEWSPNGTRLVFSQANGIFEGEIFVVGRSGRGLRQLVRSVWDNSPQWSPAGNQIAFVRGRHEIPDAYGEDAGAFATSASDRIYVMATNGSKQRLVARGYWPRWAPDGRRLAFVDVVGLKGPAEMGRLRSGPIKVADLDNHRTRELALGTAPNWSPAGDRVAFMRYRFRKRSGGPGWEVGESILLTARIDGSDVRQLNVSQEDEEGEVAALYDPQWSPDGRTIVARVADTSLGDQGIALVDAETGTVRGLKAESVTALQWSPDGTRLATTRFLPAMVGVVDIATGVTRVLARSSDNFKYQSPTWSPDGTRVGFIRCTTVGEPETCDVYTVSASGSRPKRVPRLHGIETSLDWG